MAQGLAHASKMIFICKEFQRVCCGTSDWFVPEPSQKSVQADIPVVMRRFKNLVKWKKFWRDQKQSTKNELLEEEEDTLFNADSLSTCLKPTFGLKTVKHGSDSLEVFLTAVGNNSSRRLSSADFLNAWTRKQDKSTRSSRKWKYGSVCVLIDKPTPLE